MMVANAAVIWTNPITDANPSAANPFTAGQTVASNLTVSGIGRGSGVSANAGSNRYNAVGWTGNATPDLNDYFSFTLDAANGFEIDFTNFVYTGQASGTGPAAFAFRSSLDNYATNIGTPSANGTTISLAGASFQNITAPITFRFYGFSSGGGTYSINDFTFNATIAASVPEPSTYAMLFAGAGLMVWVFRRKRSNS